MFGDCSKPVNLNDLESKLQDKVLSDEILLKLGEIIKETKDSNGLSFAELILGYKLKVSFEISEPKVKSNIEKFKVFSKNNLRVDNYLCYDERGIAYWSACENCDC
jgi:hypothetical protein